jgi:hypothetical protein
MLRARGRISSAARRLAPGTTQATLAGRRVPERAGQGQGRRPHCRIDVVEPDPARPPDTDSAPSTSPSGLSTGLVGAPVDEAKRAKVAVLLLPGLGTVHDLRRARDAGASVARIATHCIDDVSLQHFAAARENGHGERRSAPSSSARPRPGWRR